MKALFHPGLFTAHDIWHQVARLYWYQESVKDGVFPPQWIAPMAHGFGYPLFVFSYHFPWILGLGFLFLHFSIFETLKLLFILSFLFSGWGMYWCTFLFTKSKFASFVSAVLYLVAPWRFVTIFVSAAMGKAFVLTLFPFTVVSVYYLAKSERRVLPIFGLALTVTALILSHLISILTLLSVILPFIFILKPSFKKLFLSGGVTGLLTAWYVVPLITLRSSIYASTGAFKTLYLDQFINIGQLVYSRWGYGIVTANAKEGAFSYQLGFAQWVVILVCLLGFLRFKERRYIALLLVSFALCIFLMIDLSKPLWSLLSHFITIDYPTMFLMPALFLSSFLAAILLKNFGKLRVFIGLFLLILAFINNRNYMRVNQYVNPSVTDIVAAESTTNSFNEYFPITADQNVFLGNDIQIPYRVTAGSYQQTVVNEDQSEVLTHVFGFPGIVVLVDNKEARYELSESGLIRLWVNEGEHKIDIFYRH